MVLVYLAAFNFLAKDEGVFGIELLSGAGSGSRCSARQSSVIPNSPVIART